MRRRAQTDQKNRVRRRGDPLRQTRFVLRSEYSAHILLVGLDHLLDHLAADGAGFAGGQVAVVALLQVHADLPWCPK